MDIAEIDSRAGPETASSDRLDPLMASIGYLFLHWSRLEAALVDEIRRLRIAGGDSGKSLIRVRGSISERLAEWRALISLKARGNRELAQAVADLSSQIERLQRTRNLVAQSFAGASADEGEPSLFCADVNLSPPTNDPRRIPLSEMNAIIEEVRHCSRRIAQFEDQ